VLFLIQVPSAVWNGTRNRRRQFSTSILYRVSTVLGAACVARYTHHTMINLSSSECDAARTAVRAPEVAQLACVSVLSGAQHVPAIYYRPPTRVVFALRADYLEASLWVPHMINLRRFSTWLPAVSPKKSVSSLPTLYAVCLLNRFLCIVFIIYTADLATDRCWTCIVACYTNMPMTAKYTVPVGLSPLPLCHLALDDV